jgi:heptosyltransferase-2
MKIAILKLAALGDVVRTTSILRPLHQKYPGCEIRWYTSAGARPLLERNPYISALDIVRPQTLSEKIPPADLVISLDEDDTAASLASRIPSSERFGTYKDATGAVRYTPTSRAWFDMSLLNRDPDGTVRTANRLKQMNKKTYPDLLLEMLGLPASPGSSTEPVVIPSAEAETWAASFPAAAIGINSGSGARWTNKQLSIDKTVELIQALREAQLGPLLLLGGREERDRNQAIVQRSPTGLTDTGTDNSLERFVSIVNRCDVLVTSDSLALHIAAALQKRVIVFFGPTSPQEIALYDRGWVWSENLSCACFYLNRCTQTSFCLDQLPVDPVIERIQRWRKNS